MKYLSAIALMLAFAVASAASEEAASANDTAQFLAGNPVRGTPLELMSRQDSWMTHAAEFDSAWKGLDARQLSKIRAWAPTALGDAYEDRAPLFYMFSGPDILYAQTLFPNASTYVLCGLEPVGPIPDIAKLSASTVSASLGNLRKSLNSVLNFSFFITKDMKVDLRQTQLSGTLPVLFVFLARGGCKVESAEFVGLDRDGEITTGKPATNGVKVTFFGPAGREQTLYYFTADISDDGLKSNSAVTNFCAKLGNGNCLLKAASYLMHSDGFSKIRDFLIEHGKTIVEDDSGIPIRYLAQDSWNLKFFGNYVGPIEIFKSRNQPQLAELYHKSNAARLNFSFGYRWHPSESSLVVATRKSPGQPAVTAPAFRVDKIPEAQ